MFYLFKACICDRLVIQYVDICQSSRDPTCNVVLGTPQFSRDVASPTSRVHRMKICTERQHHTMPLGGNKPDGMELEGWIQQV